MSNAEIAASVARALGLEDGPDFELNTWIDQHHDPGCGLAMDGHNLFGEYWQVRCRDYLRAQGRFVTIGPGDKHWAILENERSQDIVLTCPASEFCARAIHAGGMAQALL
jgi:hypothetical protein